MIFLPIFCSFFCTILFQILFPFLDLVRSFAVFFCRRGVRRRGGGGGGVRPCAGLGCGALGEKLMVQTASAGHQKRAGATGSSRGAQVRRATWPWRTAVLGNVGGGATARERAKRRRGNEVELTASSSAVSLGSGTGCGRHIGDGDRRCPRLKMMSMAAIRRVPGCLARRGGVEGGGGALGHVRGVRGRRWPRQQQAAATAAFASGRTEEGESVRGREREQRGRKRSEGTRGVFVASLGRPGEAGGGRGSRARATPRSFWRGGRRQGEGVGSAWLGHGPVGPSGSTFYFFVFVFFNYFFSVIFCSSYYFSFIKCQMNT